jgi:hypothetical protein
VPLEGEEASVSAAIESLGGGEVPTQLHQAIDLLRSMSERLEAAITTKDEALQAKATAERERDQAVEEAGRLILQAGEIVALIAQTPLGRKTQVKEAQRTLSHLEQIYGPEMIQWMERKNDGGSRDHPALP